jgi:hypothetical protein
MVADGGLVPPLGEIFKRFLPASHRTDEGCDMLPAVDQEKIE